MNVDRGFRHPSPFEDLMQWTMTNYGRILAHVQRDVSNGKARHDWAVQADKELTALHKKWGLLE